MMAVILTVVSLPMQKAGAAAAFVKTANSFSHNTTTITATFSSAPTSGNLLVAICGADTGTITTPTGFSTAIYQTGAQAQGVYYKISNGTETSISCTTSSTFNGLHIYEYSGIDTSSPYLGSSSATGSSASPSSGSYTTAVAEAVLVAGITIGGQTSFSAWSNSFTERNDMAISSGSPGSRHTFGGAGRVVSATGTYSTTATAGASGAWRGQIAAFRAAPSVLSVDIVDSGGITVSSPSLSMSSATTGFTCSTTTGTLGTTSQRIRIRNTTTNPAWTVAIAPTSGPTASWSSGSDNYDFNDGAGTPGGCGDGADSDVWAGQLTINPSTATRTPQAGCTNTGTSLGSSAAFNEGSVSSITLISSSSAGTNCYWDLTGVSVAQTIPPVTPAGNYSINMTLTVTAS